jgi:hypothetical protein
MNNELNQKIFDEQYRKAFDAKAEILMNAAFNLLSIVGEMGCSSLTFRENGLLDIAITKPGFIQEVKEG